MNSKEVDKALRRVVRPMLKSVGFSTHRGRTSWRSFEHGCHVVNFQSFNSYLADGLECTTFSFAVNLGVYYSCIADTPWSKTDSKVVPKEYECQARRCLKKRSRQPELPRPNIWFVREDGSNLEDVVEDARKQIESKAPPWFQEFSDPHMALDAFQHRKDTFYKRSIAIELLGGGLGSLSRAEIVSALALSLDNSKLAKSAWQVVIDNPFYARFPDMLELAQSRIAALS